MHYAAMIQRTDRESEKENKMLTPQTLREIVDDDIWPLGTAQIRQRILNHADAWEKHTRYTAIVETTDRESDKTTPRDIRLVRQASQLTARAILAKMIRREYPIDEVEYFQRLVEELAPD